MTVGQQRLLALYNFLLTVPDERVDLDSWVDGGSGPKWDSQAAQQVRGCGTTACAVGWAMAMPEFNKEGLCGRRLARITSIVPSFGELTKWRAVEAFFELNEDDAQHLFFENHRDIRDSYATNNASGKWGDARHKFLDNDIEDQLVTLTDKRLALMRMRNFLHDAGAITYDQVVEMKARERA